MATKKSPPPKAKPPRTTARRPAGPAARTRPPARRRAAPRRATPPALPPQAEEEELLEAGEEPGEDEPGSARPLTLPFEIDPKAVEASLQGLREQVVLWAKRGRYTKVRFKFRGKPVLPDIPLAAVAAVEGATFYWAGLLRLLVVNVAGRALIDVELVNDSEKKLQAGKEALLAGDLDRALALFQEAVDMDHGNPQVHLNLGIARKLAGLPGPARASLEKAAALDPEGPAAAEARRLLESLKGPVSAVPGS